MKAYTERPDNTVVTIIIEDDCTSAHDSESIPHPDLDSEFIDDIILNSDLPVFDAKMLRETIDVYYG